MDPILLSLKLSCRLVFLMIITGSCLHSSSPTTSCLNMAERSKWNRSFHFNNRELRLKLEVTNRPSHWIINYIFEILARERLGYQSIEFIKQNMDHPYQAISRLDCKDVNCFKIPEVHINLELWLSLGTTTNFWIPHNRVIDNGPLGPVNRWAVSSEEGFVSQLSKLMESPEKESNCQNTSHSTDQPVNAQNEECDANLCSPSDFVNEFIRYFTGSDIISSKSSSHSSSSSSFSADQQLSSSSTTMSIIDWYPSHGPGASPLPSAFHFPVKQNQINSTVSQVVVFDTIHRCTSQLDSTILDNNHQHQDVKKKSFCRFESQQATKLSWAKLKSTVPLIYQLVDRMHFSQSEYEDLLKSANSLNPNSGVDIQSHYRDVACKWIRLSPTRWSSWTEGWNKKQNLTIAGLFSFYGKWVVSNLDHVAQQAISFVNNNPDYFSNTEYALTLDVHNLTCSQDVVLNDYFDLVTKSKDQKIIGVIAALCSDSIEPVVEVANMRRQIVVSPTVESVRFARRRQYPYFFRTVPSMTHVSLILIRLFNYWGWRRVAVFREDDHFFDPLVFQSNGIELIADFVMKENQLTYITVYQGLKLMNDRRSRIFMIEYFAKGTALILCAAYHLGMHFDSGYVWFLNPWLSGNWWQSVDIHPPECTRDEMLNMTGWTFTIGHQLIMEPLMHKQNTQRQIHRRSSSSREYSRKFKHPLYNGGHDVDADHNDDDDQDYHSSSNSAESQRSVFSTKSENIDYIDSSHDYAIHTYESVIVLATALVHLLHQNPSCISVFDTSTSIAETYKELIAETDFHYTISSKFIILDNSTSSSSSSSTTYTQPMISLDTDFRYVHKKKDNNNNNNNNNGIKSAQLRFNPFNERIADYWLLRQYQVNQSIPIVLWSLQSDLLNNGETETDPNGDGDVDAAFMRSLLLDTSDLSAFVTSEHFSQLMGERWLNDVSWSSSRNNGNNGRPPHDGSENQDDCTFGVISRLFGVNCTGSTVIVTISIVITVVILCFILFIVYYRRKLKQTQLRIRQPYENLCNELKDIDIPSTDIVLNRRVGQGAFGMVYGGEAKRNGRWEAVAVKVIGNKATYEGKTDFLSEAKLMRSLDHRNIVHLIGICLYPKENHLYLIMEFMLNGDLKTYLLSRRVLAQQMPEHEGICPATLTGMAIDIAEGLAYLHRKNLIHRDIACRNCLVGSDGVVKIGDFGLTREMNSSESEGYYRFTRNCELPIRWMSPEAVQFGVFSILSDIWSYGIVLYEIITFGVFPYDGLGDVEVVERVKRKDFSIIEFLPVAARDTIISRLIYQCCQHQWQHRPASLDHIIAILRKNPECVRPFLTDEPPKPNSTIDALRFQPGAGACIMSKNTLASGDPSPSNPVISNPTSDSTHGYPFTTGIRGVLSATGSLGGGGGIGKSLLDHHHHRSTDSFSENISTSVFLSFLSDPPLQNFGRRSHHRRRRHKTADDGCSTRISRYHDIRRGTSCSSSSSSSAYGHTFRSSEQQSFGDHRPTTIEDQPLHPTGGVSGGGGGGGRGDSVSFPMWRKSKTAEEKEKSSRLRNLLFNKQTSVEHGDDNDDDDEHVELIVSKKTTTEYSDPIHAVLNDSYTTVRQLTGDLLKNKSHIENRHEDKNLPLGSRSLSAEHMLLVDYIQKNEKPVHAKSAPDNASSSSAFTAYISQSTSKSAYILLDTDKQFTSVHNYDCQPYQDTLPNGLRVDILRENNYSNSSCKTEVVTRNACHLHTHHNTPSIFRSVLLIFSRSRRKNNSYPPDNLRITKSSVVCQPISSDSIHHTCVTSHLFSTSCPSIFTSPHFPVFNCNASDNTKNNNTNKCSIPSVSYLTTSSSTSERHQQQHQLHHRYPVKNEANRKKTGDCHAPNFVNPVSDTKTTIDCESFNSEQPVSSHHHHLSCIPPTVTSDESVRKSNHSYFV